MRQLVNFGLFSDHTMYLKKTQRIEIIDPFLNRVVLTEGPLGIISKTNHFSKKKKIEIVYREISCFLGIKSLFQAFSGSKMPMKNE